MLSSYAEAATISSLQTYQGRLMLYAYVEVVTAKHTTMQSIYTDFVCRISAYFRKTTLPSVFTAKYIWTYAYFLDFRTSSCPG